MGNDSGDIKVFVIIKTKLINRNNPYQNKSSVYNNLPYDILTIFHDLFIVKPYITLG